MTKSLFQTHYIVKHKPTGEFLPQMQGSTYWQPDRPDYKSDACVRLFKSKRGADNFITAWVKGQAFVARNTSGYRSEFFDDAPLGIEYCPVPGRSRDQLEIYSVDIVIKHKET